MRILPGRQRIGPKLQPGQTTGQQNLPPRRHNLPRAIPPRNLRSCLLWRFPLKSHMRILPGRQRIGPKLQPGQSTGRHTLPRLNPTPRPAKPTPRSNRAPNRIPPGKYDAPPNRSLTPQPLPGQRTGPKLQPGQTTARQNLPLRRHNLPRAIPPRNLRSCLLWRFPLKSHMRILPGRQRIGPKLQPGQSTGRHTLPRLNPTPPSEKAPNRIPPGRYDAPPNRSLTPHPLPGQRIGPKLQPGQSTGRHTLPRLNPTPPSEKAPNRIPPGRYDAPPNRSLTPHPLPGQRIGPKPQPGQTTARQNLPLRLHNRLRAIPPRNLRNCLLWRFPLKSHMRILPGRQRTGPKLQPGQTTARQNLPRLNPTPPSEKAPNRIPPGRYDAPPNRSLTPHPLPGQRIGPKPQPSQSTARQNLPRLNPTPRPAKPTPHSDRTSKRILPGRCNLPPRRSTAP